MFLFSSQIFLFLVPCLPVTSSPEEPHYVHDASVLSHVLVSPTSIVLVSGPNQRDWKRQPTILCVYTKLRPNRHITSYGISCLVRREAGCQAASRYAQYVCKPPNKVWNSCTGQRVTITTQHAMTNNVMAYLLFSAHPSSYSKTLLAE